jgi:hypothetical protein
VITSLDIGLLLLAVVTWPLAQLLNLIQLAGNVARIGAVLLRLA